jgi:predicted pyridoxine 5'-phosphate oxidase superfamily flavin-nucleotide-binding protein
MGKDDIRDFIDKQQLCVLSTISADGRTSSKNSNSDEV